MDTLIKRLSAVDIRISALRLDIIAMKDELNRMADAGKNSADDAFLQLKLKVLAKKFELAQMKSERKLLELQVHTGNAAA